MEYTGLGERNFGEIETFTSRSEASAQGPRLSRIDGGRGKDQPSNHSTGSASWSFFDKGSWAKPLVNDLAARAMFCCVPSKPGRRVYPSPLRLKNNLRRSRTLTGWTSGKKAETGDAWRRCKVRTRRPWPEGSVFSVREERGPRYLNPPLSWTSSFAQSSSPSPPPATSISTIWRGLRKSKRAPSVAHAPRIRTLGGWRARPPPLSVQLSLSGTDQTLLLLKKQAVRQLCSFFFVSPVIQVICDWPRRTVRRRVLP